MVLATSTLVLVTFEDIQAVYLFQDMFSQIQGTQGHIPLAFRTIFLWEAVCKISFHCILGDTLCQRNIVSNLWVYPESLFLAPNTRQVGSSDCWVMEVAGLIECLPSIHEGHPRKHRGSEARLAYMSSYFQKTERIREGRGGLGRKKKQIEVDCKLSHATKMGWLFWLAKN